MGILPTKPDAVWLKLTFNLPFSPAKEVGQRIKPCFLKDCNKNIANVILAGWIVTISLI